MPASIPTFSPNTLAGAPALVLFTADWCPSCRMLKPAVESLATELRGCVDVAQVDVDQSPDVAAAHGVRGIPTLILFENGLEVARAIDPRGKEAIVAELRPHLDGCKPHAA